MVHRVKKDIDNNRLRRSLKRSVTDTIQTMRKQTISHSEPRNCHKIAEAVDKLVMDPTNMQLWRNPVKNMLKRVEDAKSSDVWYGLLNDIDPNKDIAVLYTILAFCHDDQLRINCVITDEIKAINPKLCTYPHVCVYRTRGFDRMLDIYLRHVTRDLNSRNKQPTTNGGEQTDIIPRQPSDTTGQKPGTESVTDPSKEMKTTLVLNDAEKNIIEALGTRAVTGEKLAGKAGYPYNSNFKSTLSGLRKRGILGNKAPGYFVESQYHFLLEKSD